MGKTDDKVIMRINVIEYVRRDQSHGEKYNKVGGIENVMGTRFTVLCGMVRAGFRET